MINDILKNEEDLLATLQAVKDLTEEHQIFALKGMIPQIDKLIDRTRNTIIKLKIWST